MSDSPLPLAPLWPDAPRLAPQVAFPATRFLPGHGPHPRRDSAGSLHGAPMPPPGFARARWREDTTYLHAIDLFHGGWLWEAHEWFEACHHAATARGDAPHADLLQALVQLCAALLKRHLGEERGARILFERVRERLRAAAAGGDVVAGLRPAELLAHLALVPVGTRFTLSLFADGERGGDAAS